jgi:hypothetical protein
MATLASLKLVTAKKPTNQPPVVQRRNKLSSAIFHQIQLAKAQSNGTSYNPTRLKTVTNADGLRTQMSVPKRIKPWWFVAENGKCCIAIRYGAKVIELAKGKTAIEVNNPEALIDALEAVNTAVIAGELDVQIEAVSGQIRGLFSK